jgi:hypothetical protein
LLIVLALCGIAALFLRPQSADHRIVLWGASVLSMTPLGRGLGWWFQAHPFPTEEYVHSDLLQTMLELGMIPGLALILIPILLWWKGVADVAVRATFCALLLEAVVSFPLHFPATSFLFAAVAGALARRNPDPCRAGLHGGTLHGLSAQWARPSDSRISAYERRRSELIPVRSALAEFTYSVTRERRKTAAVG